MEKFAIIATADDNFVFVGKIDDTKLEKDFIELLNALTVGYLSTGEPTCSFTQIPLGMLNLDKPLITAIPRSNIAYMMLFDKSDDHMVCKMYDDFFNRLGL